MGLLDDAIRDHLELKRRHGADPGEVSKLEHEAFGPIQREDALEVGPTPLEDEDDPRAEHDLAAEEEAAYEESELEADEEWEVQHPPRADAVYDDELVYEDEPPATGSVRADLVDDEPPAPAPPRPPPRRRPESTTSSRRPRSSCRRRRSTTGSGSSRSRRATSTSDPRRPRVPRPLTWLDVFTSTPLQGNGLAVVHDADDVDDATMLGFARETRLSETTFVQSPRAAGADYRNRIWTMGWETAFAGHPSLGTAVAVAHRRGEREARYVQETGAGSSPSTSRSLGRARARLHAAERAGARRGS
jgi:hypothetical protein